MEDVQMGAIILAGGKSSRFGTDKATYKFKGLPLIQHVINAVAKVTSHIIIITNSPHKLDFLPYPRYKDLIPGSGPLGGIFTGLSHSSHKFNFVLPCDMPYITTDCLAYLAQHTDGNDIIVPYHQNKFEPLCAIYSKTCLPFIEEQLKTKNYQIFQFYDKVKTQKIELPFYNNRLFFNINFKEDLNN